MGQSLSTLSGGTPGAISSYTTNPSDAIGEEQGAVSTRERHWLKGLPRAASTLSALSVPLAAGEVYARNTESENTNISNAFFGATGLLNLAAAGLTITYVGNKSRHLTDKEKTILTAATLSSILLEIPATILGTTLPTPAARRPALYTALVPVAAGLIGSLYYLSKNEVRTPLLSQLKKSARIENISNTASLVFMGSAITMLAKGISNGEFSHFRGDVVTGALMLSMSLAAMFIKRDANAVATTSPSESFSNSSNIESIDSLRATNAINPRPGRHQA